MNAIGQENITHKNVLVLRLWVLGASGDNGSSSRGLFLKLARQQCESEAYALCRSYEDCCGTRCCVRALSIQRLWYFWVLLMMGVLFCCGAGFFIRRRMYPSPLRDEPAFNVSFTRHPVTSPGTGFGVNGMTGGDPGVTMTLPAYAAQPGSAHMMLASYPPPPSYCNHPPPSYEQIFQNSDKK
uniref:WW domain binding protein VOPP1 n=1 Tax=Scophthalmus maximus TaxID=52904 RepID=A0A8D3BMG5_SCOMX